MRPPIGTARSTIISRGRRGRSRASRTPRRGPPSAGSRCWRATRRRRWMRGSTARCWISWPKGRRRRRMPGIEGVAFPHIFRPLTLRHRTLRNRVVFGAHTANMAKGGLPDAQHVAYYAERARGGAAMIVVEPMPVHPAAVLTRGNFAHGTDAVIPAFRVVTEAVHEHGAVILQQLYHVGAHADQDLSFHPGWSPSGGPSWHDSDGSHAMTGAEIEETIEGFVIAATRCQAAGFDGVEVWAAYHALLDQFWTPFSNTRDDRWGGSLENRTRLSREICHRIRAACGDDFIVGLAVNDEPDVPAALGREALCEIVALHDAENAMDYVTCGSGSYFDFYKLMPTFLYPEKLGVDLAEVLMGVVRTAAVTAESHIRTPENAETVLGAGQADLVSIVRGQIADPHLVNKAKAGHARTGTGLHLVQPDVLGAAEPRLLDILSGQPECGTRVGMGRRQVRAGRGHGARRRRRACGPRGGAGGGRAGVRGDALRGGADARRTVPAGGVAAATGTDRRIAGLVRARVGAPRRRGAAEYADGRGRHRGVRRRSRGAGHRLAARRQRLSARDDPPAPTAGARTGPGVVARGYPQPQRPAGTHRHRARRGRQLARRGNGVGAGRGGSCGGARHARSAGGQGVATLCRRCPAAQTARRARCDGARRECGRRMAGQPRRVRMW